VSASTTQTAVTISTEQSNGGDLNTATGTGSPASK